MPLSTFVHWPNAPLTEQLVRAALNHRDVAFVDDPGSHKPLLQWATYDSLDHERVLSEPKSVLSSSYTFRKALIRKHFLSRVTHTYSIKNPDTVLKRAVPTTFELEISFADELDELWTDELWELGEKLDNDKSWWILKPLVEISLFPSHAVLSVASTRGMADRGMGIRIFNSKDQLQGIFEGFESDEESDNEDEEVQRDDSKTAVATSQLRHFVVQVIRVVPRLA